MPDEVGSSDTLIGREFSHYRIVKKLGGGGMGAVYKAGSMNRIVKYCLLGLVLLVSPTWSQTQTAEAEKAVAALAHQWLEADMTGNSALLAPLLADEFVDTDPDGKVSGKAEVLAAEKSTKWSSIETSDLKIIVYGDTAIAIGGAKGKGTDASGRPIEFNLRWTDTWVKMPSGKWQCVASHASAVKI